MVEPSIAAWVIVYGHHEQTPHKVRQRLHRTLFGYTDRSNNGRYEYERAGLLTGRPHRVLRPGVVLVPTEMGPEVRATVREHQAWTWSRPVLVEPRELEGVTGPERAGGDLADDDSGDDGDDGGDGGNDDDDGDGEGAAGKDAPTGGAPEGPSRVGAGLG